MADEPIIPPRTSPSLEAMGRSSVNPNPPGCETAIPGVAKALDLRRITWAVYLAIAILATFLFTRAPGRHFMTPFREGQTALLSAELARGHDNGSWLAAPTPVFGYPWEVPMEFPLFQRLVALLARSGMPLDLAGRILNLAFTLGALALAAALASKAGVPTTLVLPLFALAMLSPIYFAYGGAFLIEGCALFLAVAMIAAITRGTTGAGVWPWAVALCASVVAGVVKPTTWAPAMVGVVSFFLLQSLEQRRRNASIHWKPLLYVGGIAGVTVAVVAWWVAYSDAVKTLNPLAAQLNSTRLAAWNYGTLGQKLSLVTWVAVGGKTLLLAFGLVGPILPLIASWHWWGSRRLEFGSQSKVIFAAAAAALSAPLVFTNLHLQHDYYQFANALYLWALLALVLAAAARGGRSNLVRVTLWILLFSGAASTCAYVVFRQSLRDPADEAVLEALAQLPAGKPVAAIGFDYSGRLPYYANRPALMTITGDDVRSGRWDAALQLNRDQGYGAVVLSGPQYLDAGWRTARALGLVDPIVKEIFPRTFLLAPSADIPQTVGGDCGASWSTEISNILAEASGRPSGYRQFSLERSAGGWPCGVRVLFKRRDQVFVLRSRELTLTRLRGVD